ncbi:MAG TPA: HAD family hydrolase [Terriglobia bacterium]|nr:HAD family hydrolase [Terriglobia bacterium]
MSLTTVIFDFDGTLASSLEGIHACFQEALATFGYGRPSVAEVRRTVGLTLEESVRILTNGQCDGAKLGKVVDCYRALYTKKGRAMATLFPGAKETLTAVREMGIRIVLVSNKSHKGLCRLAEHLGIDASVNMMLGVDESSFRKPDARLFTETIAPRLAESHPRRVLMVGDTESDILFAKNAGLRSCWASYGYGDEAACKALAPEFILPNITRLPGLIHPINTSKQEE